MPPDSGMIAVGPGNHGHGIPPHKALDPPFQFPIAWIRRLFVPRNRIDVGRGSREREFHTIANR